MAWRDQSGLGLEGTDSLRGSGRVCTLLLKSLGYQIFPGDVERHICGLAEKVANCVVVGVEHEVVSEAVVAVVEKKPGVELSRRELDPHASSLPSYMRPRHWIVLEPGQIGRASW